MQAKLCLWVLLGCAATLLGCASASCRPGLQGRPFGRSLLQRGPLETGASTYCGDYTTGNGACNRNVSTSTKGTFLKCRVGGDMLAFKPRNKADSGRFDPSNFDKSCLVNAGVACDHSDNIDTASIDPSRACCSCYLYTKHCAGNTGLVYSETLTNKTQHTLLMPASPCVGVEDWNNHFHASNNCPEESIWDQGQTDIDNILKDASWGMAINPTYRRGQHQMHVHLAKIQPKVLKSIADGHLKKLKSFHLSCRLTDKQRTMEHCQLMASGTTDRYNPSVTVVTGIKAPSLAKPFESVYGLAPTNKTTNVLYTSTMVVRVPLTKDAWAVVANQAGPAECFFENNGEGACTNS